MSREIDALVAEHVMGWRAGLDTWRYGHTIWLDASGEEHAQHAWRPSVDIATAWQIVESIDRNSAACDFRVHLDHEGLWTSRLSWTNEAESRTGVSVNCESASMAICRAALDAFGVEVPTQAAPSTSPSDSPRG